MSQRKILLIAGVGMLAWTTPAQAGPMLTGTVAYNQSTHLYTYSYTLDDRSAPAPVDYVAIRIATHVYDLDHRNPLGYTAPSPFTDFFTAEGGWDSAAFPSGTFYAWRAWSDGSGVSASEGIQRGFSFTSRYGPGGGDVANYVLYSSALADPPFLRSDTQVQSGWVVAPDLTQFQAPEPATLALGFAGLALVGLRGLRSRALPSLVSH